MLHSHYSLSFWECCNDSAEIHLLQRKQLLLHPFGQQWWAGTKDVGSIPFSSSFQAYWAAREIRPDTFSCLSAEVLDWRTPNIVHVFYTGCLLLYWKQKKTFILSVFLFVSFCFCFLCPLILLCWGELVNWTLCGLFWDFKLLQTINLKPSCEAAMRFKWNKSFTLSAEQLDLPTALVLA